MRRKTLRLGISIKHASEVELLINRLLYIGLKYILRLKQVYESSTILSYYYSFTSKKYLLHA